MAVQAYFITNMEPIKFWEFMSLLLEGLGYDRYIIFNTGYKTVTPLLVVLLCIVYEIFRLFS